MVAAAPWLPWLAAEAARQIPWLVDSLTRREKSPVVHCPHLHCPDLPPCPAPAALNLTGLCEQAGTEHLIVLLAVLAVSGFWAGLVAGVVLAWTLTRRHDSSAAGAGAARRRGGGVLE